MLTWCDCYAPVIGRVLMGGYFLWNGLLKAATFSGTVGYVASAGLPEPTFGAIAAIVIEIGFGIMLIVGWKSRTAALALVTWTIIVTLIYHTGFSEPLTMTLFLKNMAIIGGLMYMSAFSSGTFSFGTKKASA